MFRGSGPPLAPSRMYVVVFHLHPTRENTAYISPHPRTSRDLDVGTSLASRVKESAESGQIGLPLAPPGHSAAYNVPNPLLLPPLRGLVPLSLCELGNFIRNQGMGEPKLDAVGNWGCVESGMVMI